MQRQKEVTCKEGQRPAEKQEGLQRLDNDSGVAGGRQPREDRKQVKDTAAIVAVTERETLGKGQNKLG